MYGGRRVPGSTLSPPPGPGPVLRGREIVRMLVRMSLLSLYLDKKSARGCVGVEVSKAQPATEAEEQQTDEDGDDHSARVHGGT